MRYVIYGAGGIGSIMGGNLARAGQEVVLVGRPGHVNAVNNNGLRLITPTGTHIVHVPAVTGPEQVEFTGDEVVCLCVKGQDTEGALKDLKKETDDVPVFCFQNGVRNEEIAIQYFPRIYGVMVNVGAVYLEDGEVIARRDPPGWYVMGRYPEGTDGLVEAIAEDLRTASYFVRVSPEVMPYKWGKLRGNLANAIGAITNGRRDDYTPIVNATQAEFQDIAAEAGIRWLSNDEITRDWSEINAPPRGSLTTEAQSSTWQSLARHQGNVESEYLNGEVVRLAKRIGRTAPINEGLLRICQEMAANREPPGKYTTAQLSAILGINTKE